MIKNITHFSALILSRIWPISITIFLSFYIYIYIVITVSKALYRLPRIWEKLTLSTKFYSHASLRHRLDLCVPCAEIIHDVLWSQNKLVLSHCSFISYVTFRVNYCLLSISTSWRLNEMVHISYPQDSAWLSLGILSVLVPFFFITNTKIFTYKR